MKKDIILSGVGGQGILSIATVIGQAALKDGLYMKQAEVHGMSQAETYSPTSASATGLSLPTSSLQANATLSYRWNPWKRCAIFPTSVPKAGW